MRYYVLGDDGQKYGPAEVATLEQWAGEGRLMATSRLEEEGSGTQITAGQLMPARFVTAPPPAAAPIPTPVYVPQPHETGEDRKALIGIGLAFLSVIILFSPIRIGAFLSWTYGIQLSWASRNAQKTLAWIGIVLNAIAGLIWIAAVIFSYMPSNS